MPKYIFTIRAGHEGDRAEQAAVLNFVAINRYAPLS